MHTPPAIRLILLSFLALSVLLGVSACGFQPRGHALNLSGLPGPVTIVGVDRYSPLHRELSRQLDSAGIGITDTISGAGSILRLRDLSSSRRVLSVDSRNKQVEYELEESVRFSLRSGSDDERVPEQTVRVLRIQYNPEDEVLGRSNEEQMLRKDMRRDLAGRILQRLATQY